MKGRVHERGRTTARGCFAAADGGTIFLDEIGDMSPNSAGEAACACCRSAASSPWERRIRRAQSRRSRHRRDQSGSARSVIDEKRFREDLYYRLNVVCRSRCPSLRDAKREDLPLLVHHFLDRLCHERNNEQVRFDQRTRRLELTSSIYAGRATCASSRT